MSSKILAERQDSPVSGRSGTLVSWFESKPMEAIDHSKFALQLETKSSEAVKNGDPDFWFEISIFDERAKTSSKTWVSHMNESVSTFQTDVWHFGPIFYPNHELIRGLKAGDIIRVGICSKPGSQWSGLQVQGRLVMKPLATGHFTWSLRDIPGEGVYTISTSDECVSSVTTAHENGKPVTNLWFKTPVSGTLNQDNVSRLNSVKLFTNARHQGYITDKRQGIWSWFELAAFEDNDGQAPLSDNTGPLTASSHKIEANANQNQRQEGKLFIHGDDFVSRLKAGNIIGMRVCAQYSGWENHATYGRLLIGLSGRKTSPLPLDEAKLVESMSQLLSVVMSNYGTDIIERVLRELEMRLLKE